jgi:hypothetical protein
MDEACKTKIKGSRITAMLLKNAADGVEFKPGSREERDEKRKRGSGQE